MSKWPFFILTIGALLMSPQVRAETPRLEDLPLQQTIECFGITWTFSQAVRVGRFVNGDYYVVGNVTVASITPAATAERNGSVLNIPLDQGRSGFDSRTSSGRYTASWRANPPIALKPGDCLVSSVSINAAGDFEPWLREGNETPVSYVKTVSALTCLAAPVPTDAFRPSYCDRGQKIYLASSLQRYRLPRLPTISGAPDIKTWAWHYRRPWNEVCFFNFDAAIEYQACYARENGRAAGIATLLLSGDYAEADLETLLINFVQHGIDLWGIARAGYPGWQAHGGHGSGRKWPIIFAGLMLGDPEMAAPTQTYPNLKFGEDMQTMYDNCWTGASVVYAGHQGVWNGRPVNSDPAWGPYEHLQPSQWASMMNEDYRRCCTSIAWVGEMLSALIFGAKDLWDHDAFFDYCDRWMTEDDTQHIQAILAQTGSNYSASYLRQRRVWDGLVNQMYTLYRNNLPPVGIGKGPVPGPGSQIKEITVQPNPVQDKTAISFVLPRASRLEVRVINLKGEEVDTIVSKHLSAGAHQLTWDGRQAERGKYLLLIKGDNFLQAREIIKL